MKQPILITICPDWPIYTIVCSTVCPGSITFTMLNNKQCMDDDVGYDHQYHQCWLWWEKRDPRIPDPAFFPHFNLVEESWEILNHRKNTPENSEKYSPKKRIPEAKSRFPTMVVVMMIRQEQWAHTCGWANKSPEKIFIEIRIHSEISCWHSFLKIDALLPKKIFILNLLDTYTHIDWPAFFGISSYLRQSLRQKNEHGQKKCFCDLTFWKDIVHCFVMSCKRAEASQ